MSQLLVLSEAAAMRTSSQSHNFPVPANLVGHVEPHTHDRPPILPTASTKRKPITTNRDTRTTEILSTYVGDDNRVIIAVFNHKGGVAKTTLSVNLAYALAGTCNVLLTEADQQCNIQQFFSLQLRDHFSEDDEGYSDDDNDLDEIDETDEIAETVTTSGKLSMPRQGARVHKDAKQLPGLLESMSGTLTNNLYDAIRNYIIGDDQKKTPQCHRLPPPKDSQKNVWFLPGSPNIIELETSLSLQDRDSSGIGHHRLDAFRRMMLDTMKELDCRIAVVDFGPHSGLLNRVLVTSCDLIVPPSFPDALSFASSRSLLQSVLPSWYKWHAEFTHRPENKFMKKSLPFILPFIVTNYHVRSGRMHKNASNWTVMLQSLTANDDLVNSRRIPVDIKDSVDPIPNSNVIAICKHDEALMGLAQNLGKAFIELDFTGLSKAQQKSVTTSRNEFQALARLIMDTIAHKSEVIQPKPKRKKSHT